MNLKRNIVEKDAKFLLANEGELVRLIETNPFSERIKYLIANPRLAVNPVPNVYGGVDIPNPLGTALYVAGVNGLDHPYSGLDPEIWEHLQDYSNGQPGDFIISPKREREVEETRLIERVKRHVGIYIGDVEKRQVSFSQQGKGGMFGFELVVGTYPDPEFYRPRTINGDD